MELKIGIAQLDNSLNWKANTKLAKNIINKFAKNGADLVCFQEAYLSGYHARVFKQDSTILPELIDEIRIYAYKKNICVFYPTIEKINKFFYSSVYIFNSDHGDKKIYKFGLTPSEKKVMKPKRSNRYFKVNGVKLATLICREMEDPLFTYLNKKNLPDLLLWPSYWGWKYHHKWGPIDQNDGKKAKPFSLMAKLKRPMIQINMSTTVRFDMTKEKYGKSVIIDKNNKKVGLGKYGQEDLILISFKDYKIKKLPPI